MIKAIRYHDISVGHRVTNHESKCQHLHGHNYRSHFHCEAPALDALGRVIDFSVIKSTLCMWLEDTWDHHFLIYTQDPLRDALLALDPTVVVVPFNPTAENIAIHLVDVIAPQLLKDTGITLVECIVEETRKCSASYSI
jgi:6-pyruvoyltetrahydropterin/6-carboxytetrahydropterin synthase